MINSAGVDAQARGALAWPPPGLERLLGRGWRAVRGLLAGAGAFVLPILWVMSASRVGALLASALLFLTSAVGLFVLIGSLGWIGWLAWRARRAMRVGYDWLTVAEVLADRRGDGGALVAGTGRFTDLDPAVRRRAREIRLIASLVMFVAGVSLPVLLLLALGLASHGVLGPTAVWVVSLGLPALCTAGAAWGVRRDRRYGRRAPEPLGAERTAQWQESLRGAEGDQGVRVGRRRPTRWIWLGLGSVAGGLLLATVLVATLVPLAGVSALLEEFSESYLSPTALRAGVERQAELARRYRLEPDPDISPEEGGVALHTVYEVGRRGERSPYVRPPPHEFEQGWLPDRDGGPLGVPPQEWATTLFEMAAGGFTSEQRLYLEQIAAHPAFADYGVAARAPSADILAARFELPFHSDLTTVTLPLQPLVSLREAADAHVAKAALDLSHGHLDAAETTLRQIVSVGVLQINEATTYLESSVGAGHVRMGLQALEAFYEAAGMDQKGRVLSAVRDSAAAVEDAVRSVVDRIRRYTDATNFDWEQGSALAQDSTVTRGLRWETVLWWLALAPCRNLRAMVFGPDVAETMAWKGARASLVRRPSEAALFDLARETPERMRRAAAALDLRPPPLFVGGALLGGLVGNPRLEQCMTIVKYSNVVAD